MTPSPLRILLPFSLGYFFSYCLRTINGAIAPRLAAELGLDAATLGLMTSAYFLAFASAQLPIGLAIDRFGPRRVNVTLLAIAVSGCLLFALARDAGLLIVARSLIGFGVSGCLMTAIKANAQWFPLARLPALSGWVSFAGLFGAVVSTLPVAWIVERGGIETVFLLAAGVGLTAALVQWTLVPDHPTQQVGKSLRQDLAGMVEVFTARRFWSLAAVAAVALGSHMAMQGLWVGQWLRQVRHLDETQAGATLMMMMLGGLTGALLWGQLASRLARRGIPTLWVYAGASALHLVTLGLMAADAAVSTTALIVVYGLSGIVGNLTYAVITSRFPVELAGRANTSVNLLIFVVAFITQAGYGYALAALTQQGLTIAQAYGVVLGGTGVVVAVLLLWALLDRSARQP
ncbi:MFS transporter [Chitinimonas lacunae]|uniref:MFS transporter n=1 Tax=Chitinimonas lacunae TaxID=1963018 RepID=A0ABV8MP18_9NEIS